MDDTTARWSRLANAIVSDAVDLADALTAVDPGLLQAPDPRHDPPRLLKIRVYRRDGWTCRYCGRRVIFEPVFAVLGLLHPREVPFNPNWKTGATHPDVRLLAGTIDHLVPWQAGGSDDLENLMTACARCNYRKADYPFEGELLPPGPVGWHGLSDVYPELARRAGVEQTGAHRAWLKALAST